MIVLGGQLPNSAMMPFGVGERGNSIPPIRNFIFAICSITLRNRSFLFSVFALIIEVSFLKIGPIVAGVPTGGNTLGSGMFGKS
tara:strand:- start:18171 stop:18422 length:252 start_codon:yes stop_codon:yes gene_type:complete